MIAPALFVALIGIVRHVGPAGLLSIVRDSAARR